MVRAGRWRQCSVCGIASAIAWCPSSAGLSPVQCVGTTKKPRTDAGRAVGKASRARCAAQDAAPAYGVITNDQVTDRAVGLLLLGPARKETVLPALTPSVPALLHAVAVSEMAQVIAPSAEPLRISV